jgi:hypothetical protein
VPSRSRTRPTPSSGDNPRAVISIDGTQFYMAGNADSSLNGNGNGPGTTIGIRLGNTLSTTSIQLGTYVATDRPDESKKQHIKDNNWRGVETFNGNLYVSKGSGGNGDDGIFQVLNGTANGIPTAGTTNSIVQLLGTQATNPVTGATCESPKHDGAILRPNMTGRLQARLDRARTTGGQAFREGRAAAGAKAA